MYLILIALPLLGLIAYGFFGKKVGVNGSHLITCSCVIITTILAVIGFFEVNINNIFFYMGFSTISNDQLFHSLWCFTINGFDYKKDCTLIIKSKFLDDVVNWTNSLWNINLYYNYIKPMYSATSNAFLSCKSKLVYYSSVKRELLINSPTMWDFCHNHNVVLHYNMNNLLGGDFAHLMWLGFVIALYRGGYMLARVDFNQLLNALYYFIELLIKMLIRIYPLFRHFLSLVIKFIKLSTDLAEIIRMLKILYLTLALYPRSAAASQLTSSQSNTGLSIGASIGSVVYWLTGSVLDYVSLQVAKNPSTSKKKRAGLGGLYTLWIAIGIFWTNCVWYLSRDRVSNLSAAIIGTALSIIFSSIWRHLSALPANENYTIINSLFRSLMESLMFLSIVVSTYGTWNLWSHIDNYALIGMILGTVLFIPLSVFIILAEYCGWNCVVFGTIYTMWWSAAVFSTNGILEYFFAHYTDYSILLRLTVFLIGLALSSIFYPSLYPQLTNSYITRIPWDNYTWRSLLIFLYHNPRVIVIVLYIMFRLYVTILGYVFVNAILFYPFT